MVEQNAQRRHLWPGAASYRVPEAGWSIDEMLRQVSETRARVGRGPSTGIVFYNASTTLTASGGALASALARGPFAERAVVPASPWLDATAPARPTVTVVEGAATGGGREWALTLRPGDADVVRWWLVRWRSGGAWSQQLIAGDLRSYTLRPGVLVDQIAVHALDGADNLSDAERWRAPTVALSAESAERYTLPVNSTFPSRPSRPACAHASRTAASG